MIDWFTVIAQVVNFVVLVLLLKHFLYGPIIRAMDKREQEIAARLRDAEQERLKAEQEAENYRTKNRDLDEMREREHQLLRDDLDRERKKGLKVIREEAGEREKSWHRHLEKEKDKFFSELGRLVSSETITVSRRVLKDLAGVELETMMIDMLSTKMAKISWPKIVAAGENVIVTSGFELSPAAKRKLEKNIRKQAGQEIEIQFKTAGELISGIEIRIAEHKVSWNFDHYLQTLEQRVAESLETRLTSEPHKP